VAKEPDRRGELEENRKTIARGMPGDSGVTVATTCTLFAAAHRRPAFPAPSDERVEENFSKARADCAARFMGMSRGRHRNPTGRANARPMTGHGDFLLNLARLIVIGFALNPCNIPSNLDQTRPI
jgi:hypothetical protein